MTDGPVSIVPLGRRPRAAAALIFMVGVGLVAAAYAIWVQGAQISQNRATVHQQQRVVEQLLDQSAADRAEQEQLRRLVLALQSQVRQLGGTPLLQAPTAPASPATADPTPADAPPPTRTPAAPTPSRSPQASPRPRVSPSPSPSPTASALCAGPICLPRRLP